MKKKIPLLANCNVRKEWLRIGCKLDHVCGQAGDNGDGDGMNLPLAAHTRLGVWKCHAGAQGRKEYWAFQGDFTPLLEVLTLWSC